nr:phosphatidylinositol phosphatase PTPRQ isoform X1 [Parasteatoda tepidariorum]
MHWVTILLCLVAFIGITKTEETCGDSWSVNYEVKPKTLVVRGSASEGAIIKISIQSLDTTISKCILKTDANTEIKNGEFITPPFPVCGNTGYNVSLSIECENIEKGWKEKIIWTPPEAPSNVKAEEVTESSFFLKWDSPFGGIISTYKIQLNEEIFTQNNNDPFYRAEDLQPNTNYTVRVSARGKEEWSDSSHQIVVRTKKSLHPPVLELRDVTNTTVILGWEDLGDLLYTLKWNQETVTTNFSTIRVENLTPFTYYDFYVRVSDGNRIGNWSVVRRVQTKPGVPFPPRNVREKSKGSRNISLEWDEPQPSRGDITLYSVRSLYSRKRSIQPSNVLSTNETWIVIEGLKPARRYVIQMSASTEAGMGNWTEPLSITTLSEPPFPPENITVTDKTEKSLSLQWNLPAQKTGRIQFYTVEWNDRDSLNTTELKCTIEDLKPYTTYYIRIKSWNDAGFGNWSDTIAETTAAGVPSHPLKIQNTSLTNSSIELTWDEPYPYVGPILFYKIKWTSSKTEGDAEALNRTHLIQDLSPYTNYTIQVQAKTDAGFGPWSDPIITQTKDGIPSAPLNLREKGVTNSSIEMEWDEPHPVVGSISLYKLKWLNMKNNSWAEKETEASTFLIDGLNPYTNYSISVQAKTNAGYGAWSKPVVILTDIGVPSSPLNLREKGVTNSSIEMEWDEPHPVVGSISLYKLKWLNMRNNSWAEKEIEASAYLIDGLNPYTNYSISVQAKTNAGYGAWSEPVVIQTDIGVPLSPINLRENLTTNTSLGIAWDSPGDSAGPIVLYKVRWMDMSNSRNGEQETKDRVFRIQKLKPYQYYFIQVQAKTIASYGPWSKQLRLRTSEGVPSAPKNVRGKDVKNTSIEIEWDIPKPDVGPITVYRIRWTNNTRSNLHETKETFYLIKDLIPFSNYTIEVQAETKASPGKWSEPATIQTSVGIPSAPKNVRGKDVKNTSIEIEWDIPKPDVGPITLYRIRWTNTTRSNLHETKETFYLIKDLIPFTSYTIEVQAETEASPGKWSEPASIQTSVGIPSAPQNVRGKDVKNTSIEIEWDIPKPDVGPITLYRIRWTNNTRSNLHETKETFYLIKDLIPFTNYTIEVQAETKASPGKWSEPATIQTSVGIPSAPERLVKSHVTNHTIEVIWEAPQPNRGPILFYTVQWGSHNDTTNELEYVIDGLNPYTDYYIAVRAKTEAGYGKFSDVLRVRTKIGIPSIPRSVSDASKNATYLRLTWLQPQPMNGPLDFYKVQWNAVDDNRLQTVFTNDTTFEFFPLLPYTNYNFQVSASTVEGWGEPSVTFTTRTGIAVPPEATVTFLKVENSTDYLAEWRVVAPYPGPTTYAVYVWKFAGQCEGGGRIHDILRGSKSRKEWNQPTEVQVYGLTAYSRYSVSVQLKTEAGETKSNDSEPIHTPAEAPGPPTNVRANCEEKSTEADVSWSLPANPNSKITHYFVEYGSEYLGYREVSVKVNDVCQVQKITLRGLRPERDYKISVRAIGEGVTKKGEQASPPTSCLLPAGGRILYFCACKLTTSF